MAEPFVSVVMPVLNEASFIMRALGAVLAQDYPADCLEVLVMDGGSTDPTRALVRSMRDPRIRLLNNPGRIQSCGLNRALDVARGDVIVRVDGHTIIAPDYVSRCVHYLHATGAANVGGLQRMIGLTPMGRAIAAAYRSPFGVPSRFTTSQRAGYVDTVYMGAWPRAVFDQVGRFNEALSGNEDYEFNYRIRRAGGRIFLSPDIRSEYYGRQTIGALWRQFFRYGRWKCAVLLRHPASVRPRHLVAPAFVAALAGGALLAPFRRGIRQLWIALLATYGTAATAAAIQASRVEWLRLLAVFPCIHLAWGSGLWIEALRRVTRR